MVQSNQKEGDFMNKMIPIGVSEFREIREKNYYYVDKTNLIADLLMDGTKVTLFTRPRRFGKTLNMTMLREFFDITKDSKYLFEELEIEKNDCFHEINTYPTLFFSFRSCKGDKESVLENIKATILDEYLKYNHIKEKLDEYELERYQQIFTELKNDISADIFYTKKAITFLSKVLCKFYNKPVILIIDEYDTPMVEAYMGGYYDELRTFFTALYGNTLKDNPFLEKGILTGIQRIAKENIFSGLNNLDAVTVSEKEYNQYFGLTAPEVSKLLSCCDLELTEEVTNMYNGYNFGGLQIYNPWSITNYARKMELKPYWVHTSTNALIRKLIQHAEQSFFQTFELLIENGQVEIVIDPRTSFWELNSTETLWGLLLNAGYVTVRTSKEGLTSTIAIPNHEVKTEFQEIVGDYGCSP